MFLDNVSAVIEMSEKNIYVIITIHTDLERIYSKMEIENALNITNKQDLRNWLEIHSSTENFCWVVINKTETSEAVPYLDIVEEALCFGWIDGIKKKSLRLNQLKDFLQEEKEAIGRS